MAKKTALPKYVNFIPSEDTESLLIQIDRATIPVHLRRYAKQLEHYLQFKYKEHSCTRQLKREINREIAQWVEDKRDPGYIKWDGTDQYDLIKEKFPQPLQRNLHELADLLNLTFYGYPEGLETRELMIDFCQDWIDMNTMAGKEKINEIHQEILNKIRDQFGTDLVNTEKTREEVSKLISNTIAKKREALLSERIISQATQIRSAATSNGGSSSDGEERSAE